MTLLGGILAALGRSRRVPRRGFNVLTSKQGPRTFYKGKGAAPTGKHTSKGRPGRVGQGLSSSGRWAGSQQHGVCGGT